MANQKPSLSFSRREFMRTSSLAGGGLLIGFNLFQACKPETKAPIDLASLDYNDFNAFIKIAENGAVTIFSPNPEIGQVVNGKLALHAVPCKLEVGEPGARIVDQYINTSVGGDGCLNHTLDLCSMGHVAADA